MTSSPPSANTQINTSGTSVPPINPPINPVPITSLPPRVAFNAPHTGASSQNPFGIHWPPASVPGASIPYTEPIHLSSRPPPFIPPFPDLHTPNVNTVPQAPNFTPFNKETMRQNIRQQITFMQQQLDALDHDETIRNQETSAVPSRSSTRRSGRSSARRKVQKDNEGESSSTNVPNLQDAQLTRKIE